MGAWPFASCQEQQQSCHWQKDAREALVWAEEGWEGETAHLAGGAASRPPPRPCPHSLHAKVWPEASEPPLGKTSSRTGWNMKSHTRAHIAWWAAGAERAATGPPRTPGMGQAGCVHWGAPPAPGPPSAPPPCLQDDPGTQGWQRARAWGRETGTRQEASQGHRLQRLLPSMAYQVSSSWTDKACGDLCQGQAPPRVTIHFCMDIHECPPRPQDRMGSPRAAGFGSMCVCALVPEADMDQHWRVWWHRGVGKAMGSPTHSPAMRATTSQRQSTPQEKARC